MSIEHEIFLSYSRKDNVAKNPGGEGWVTAFERELKTRHRSYSGRELHIFFDTLSIDIGRDWKRELGAGIRSSRLFLAFLSPNYITSQNCLWEWDEYLRREHSAARGDDGITPIFFVTPSDLTAGEDQRLAAWLEDLNRRNRQHHCELQPWFERGPEILAELDAAERSAAVKSSPRAPAEDLRTLGERLDALDRRIAARLDQIALADLAPGNVVRSHEHFVGRHHELSTLHTLMMTGGPQSGGRGMGGRGMIAAAHSPGGLGKTALARQYAHAYAGFYAAGGTWEIGCEGVTKLGAALLTLADHLQFKSAGRGVLEPLVLSEAERADPDLAAVAVLDHLKRLTFARVTVLREALKRHPDRHSPEADLPVIEQPRGLLIFDNVDRAELLRADQAALLPAEEWLEVIVTTRLDPARFGVGARWARAVEIEPLPEADALDLLRDFQPDRRFSNEAEEQAAREIVRLLGGYTLAVELVAAYLGAHAAEGYQPSEYLLRLRNEGLFGVDTLAGDPNVAKEIRHDPVAERNRMATLIRWSLDRLSPPARAALEFASLLQPDQIPLAWLERLTRQQHEAALTDQPGHPSRWGGVWRELHGLRLLHPAEASEVDEQHQRKLPQLVRIHRLVAEHVTQANPHAERTLAELDQFLDVLTTLFEQQVGKSEDAALRAQHPWLRDHLSHLIAHHATRTLLTSARVVASFEGEHNSLSRALELFERILKGNEKLLAATPDSTDLARDVSVSLNNLADFLARRGLPGDAEQALRHYERCHQVLERLLDANPESALAARDVSVSLNKLADFLASRGLPGDAEQAFAYYERDLDISERLLDANPESAQAARDVSVSLNNLADFLAHRGLRGDAEQALRHYERCHQVLERLLDANPESAQAARDVSVSLEKLADFLASRGLPGDAEQAFAYYERDLDISERLLDANPESAQAARDVSVSLNKLADFLASRGLPGDAEQVLRHYERCHQVLERLLDANPESALAARDVSVSLNKLANFLARRGLPGDAEQAFAYYERDLDISERLLDANPESAQAARDVMVSLERMAQAVAAQPGADAARRALEHQSRALGIALKLRESNPQSVFYGRTAAVSFYLTFQRAQAAGQADLANQCLAGCHAVLHQLITAGCQLDPPMMRFYQQLNAATGGPPSEP